MKGNIMTISINAGALGPFMKAIAPAILALIGAAVNSLATGKIDQQSLVIAITGVAAAIITFLVPNSPKPAPAPPAAKQYPPAP